MAETVEFEIKRDIAPAEPVEEEVFAVDDLEGAEPKRAEEDEPEFEAKGIFEFSTPISIDGDIVDRIRYDFTRLKPVDVIGIVQAVGKRENVAIPQLNLSVQANVFCRATSLPPAIFKTQMAVPDFMAACSVARDFLLSGKGAKKEEDLI